MTDDEATTEVWVDGEYFNAPAEDILEAGALCNGTPPTAEAFERALQEVRRGG